MSLIISDRFQAGDTLVERDRLALSKVILDSDDVDDLTLAIDIYFQVFPCKDNLLERVKTLLDFNPKPNLSVVCLRALVEYCPVSFDVSLNYTRRFVDFSLFDEWVDEVIYSSHYFHKHQHALSAFDNKRLLDFLHQASVSGASELISLLS
ncbi:hypothetical protein G4G27_05325 [Sphingomonas sp. So64.6b]|uniref:hypothetical protein n=1 Tax=Sphingomonas sp. So64.6b TaxID=2997354 RepID=UPI001603A25E|nr:hypothetical protein [Sphingomonas sp. So64.6b]QNA83489.1 hypothetical protein G4G27_05325 [Sphingomonas sp. So64.6b]